MIIFNNHNLLRIWENGTNLHSVDRALLILHEAFPKVSWNELVNLNIGSRNSLLFNIREKTFGKEVQGMAKCEYCGKMLEFIAGSEDILKGPVPKESVCRLCCDIEGDYLEIEFHRLSSSELAKAAVCKDVKTGAAILARHSVIRIIKDSQEVSFDDLSDLAIQAIASKMYTFDPNALMKIDLECPECKADLDIPFDITAFFWEEITSAAKRFMQEVNTLARHYGWSEKDILSMSAIRRHKYLEMAGT